MNKITIHAGAVVSLRHVVEYAANVRDAVGRDGLKLGEYGGDLWNGRRLARAIVNRWPLGATHVLWPHLFTGLWATVHYVAVRGGQFKGTVAETTVRQGDYYDAGDILEHLLNHFSAMDMAAVGEVDELARLGYRQGGE